MPDLSATTLTAWRAKLPEDIRNICEDPQDRADVVQPLCLALEDCDPAAVPDVVRAHGDAVIALGRIGRLRLMSWLAARSMPESSLVFHRLTHDEDEEGSGDQAPIGILFLEDLKAYAEAIKHRVASKMVNNLTLDAAVQAAFTLEGDLVFGMETPR